MSFIFFSGEIGYATSELDRIEIALGPLAENVRQTRALIGGIEMCHHKAERWVERIIDAIGSGEPGGGLGSRSQGQRHPIETSRTAACEALAAWREGQTAMRRTALPARTDS